MGLFYSMPKATSGAPLVVAAIDFGTTYSGWAFSFKHDFETDPCKVMVGRWFGTQLMTGSKAPTCVLIKPDGKTFDAFGYEAETKYSELSDDNDHKQWYYFQRFKLMLENKPIHKDTMLVDECGKQLSALRVFSLAIRYMVDDLTKKLTAQVRDINLQEYIHWVLTVPAIWNDSAKDCMSLAAQEAGLSMKKLTIVLEPVAASLYCMQKLANTPEERFEFGPGNKFLVLDAGATVDITVYEVCFGGKLKELYKATAGFCGGEMVDKAFISFLAEFTGKETMERCKKEHSEDYIELMRSFETKKRELSDKTVVFTVRLPISLIQLVNDIKGQTFAQIIQGSRYAKQVTLIGEKLRVDANLFHSFFKQSIDSIHNFVAAELRQSATLCVETIVMVGAYLESTILQKAIKEKFPRMKVNVPRDAGLAVLKGAVIFGHRPIEVSAITDSPIAFASDLQATRSKDLGKRGDQQRSESQRPSWSEMPPYWEPMNPDEIVRQVRLQNTGDEFNRVLSNFTQTLNNREIFTIHRIQSAFLWEHYCVKKKEMEKINGTDGANEKIIFHGTKPDIIESICAENLDIRLAGTNVGAILGHGTYFATDAKMSDCYATPDPNSGRRYMLQCRVLVGRWAKGEQGLRRPPEITESASDGYRRRYNSCVDNVLNPRIFCIFDHVQYYPEYVIEYE